VRGSPDVSYHANPGTGYAVYDSFGFSGASRWFQAGGTSAGTPQWAALGATVNSMRVAARKGHLSNTNNSLYVLTKKSLTTEFNSVTQGTNGFSGEWCTAAPCYDTITGLDSPKASALTSALIAQ
jgi:subtilase family serine protease